MVELREEKLAKVSMAQRIAGVPTSVGATGSCLPGRSFGCYPVPRGQVATMWVSRGCRALFFCNGAKSGICGSVPSGANAASFAGTSINCSCSHDREERDRINGEWWAAATKPTPLRLYTRPGIHAPLDPTVTARSQQPPPRRPRRPKRPRWLLATSIACVAGGYDAALVESDVANFGCPDTFHLWVNLYRGGPTSACLSNATLALPYVRLSAIPGYMTLFWKHALVPEVTRQYDVIVIKDGACRQSTAALAGTPYSPAPHSFIVAS